MSRPLLQLALDHTSLQAAQRDVALLQAHVDIVEAGTILCLTEGLSAVKALRAQCPGRSSSPTGKSPTPVKPRAAGLWRWRQLDDHHLRRTARHGRERPRRGPACGGEIQMELFGNWTWMTPAHGTVPASIRQFTIADAMPVPAGSSGEADLARMKALSDIGLELSITGGITPADLPLFKDINVKAFIAGRALAGCPSGAGCRRIPRANRRYLGRTACVTTR